MRSLIGALVNRAPVPYVTRGDTIFAPPAEDRKRDFETYLGAMEAQSTLFAIVDRLATSTSAVRFKLYREGTRDIDAHDGGTEVTTHAALQLLRKPNPFYTEGEFRETLQQHYELTGEMWSILVRSDAFPSGPPLEWWPARPDRMRPVPSRTNFISGYLHKIGDEETPLTLDEVIFNKRPNPVNMYRGASPIGSLIHDIEGEKSASLWNTMFFRNGAEPGGIIEVEDLLADEEFDRIVQHWNSQHKGVRNAHKVAVIEKGQWKDRRFTMRDMQFEQLRRFSRETFRQAYGFPKPLLGDVEDVNRANAEAAEVVFGRWLLQERLIRWRTMLNDDFLAAFGTSGRGVEFDFNSPIPEFTDAAQSQTPGLDSQP